MSNGGTSPNISECNRGGVHALREPRKERERERERPGKRRMKKQKKGKKKRKRKKRKKFDNAVRVERVSGRHPCSGGVLLAGFRGVEIPHNV